MKTPLRYLLVFCLLAAGAVAGHAQTTSSSGGTDAHARLMQEYMAKRAELIALREQRRAAAKQPKDVQARSAVSAAALARQEQAAREALGTLATQLKASADAKREQGTPRG